MVVVVILLASVFDRVRPTFPQPLAAALDVYFALFDTLLLRGSTDHSADCARLESELDDAVMLTYVKVNVVEWEFGRIVKTVGDDGPGPFSLPLTTLWPPMIPSEEHLVADLAHTAKLGIGQVLQMEGAKWLRRDIGKSWELPPEGEEKRGRGQPRDRRTEGLLAMGTREKMFDHGARPYADVAAAIATLSGGNLTRDSAYRRMKAVRASAPLPTGWDKTLWYERIQPLHVDHFGAPRLGTDIPDD